MMDGFGFWLYLKTEREMDRGAHFFLTKARFGPIFSMKGMKDEEGREGQPQQKPALEEI